MRVGHIELYCTDPQRSAVFYRDVLGFEITVEQSTDLIWLQLGSQEFLLRKGTPPATPTRYEETRAGIVLYTDDLEDSRTALSARGLQFLGTVDSDKCLTFTDLDGNWFQLVNPNDH